MDLLTDSDPPAGASQPPQPTTTWFIDRYGIVLEEVKPIGRDRRWWVALSRTGARNPADAFLGTCEWVADHPPQLGEVLVGLASEAADVEQAITMDEWSRSAGVAAGSDLSQRYAKMLDQANRLRGWLPVGAYEVLLWDVMLG